MHSAIAENLARIQDRINEACARAKRSPATVTLVAVTKTVGLEEVRLLHSLGVDHFGENRLHAAEHKITALRDGFVWHMIGNVQRKKAKEVVKWFDTVDSVDREELADELARRLPEDRGPLPVLVEVNVSGEASKHGFSPDSLPAAIEHIAKLNALKLEGLMTMAPFFDDPEKARPVFGALRELAHTHNLPRISMGMSNDFEIAIEEGATEIRVGTALFEGTT